MVKDVPVKTDLGVEYEVAWAVHAARMAADGGPRCEGDLEAPLANSADNQDYVEWKNRPTVAPSPYVQTVTPSRATGHLFWDTKENDDVFRVTINSPTDMIDIRFDSRQADNFKTTWRWSGQEMVGTLEYFAWQCENGLPQYVNVTLRGQPCVEPNDPGLEEVGDPCEGSPSMRSMSDHMGSSVP